MLDKLKRLATRTLGELRRRGKGKRERKETVSDKPLLQVMVKLTRKRRLGKLLKHPKGLLLVKRKRESSRFRRKVPSRIKEVILISGRISKSSQLDKE
jgi:hypothetical protein